MSCLLAQQVRGPLYVAWFGGHILTTSGGGADRCADPGRYVIEVAVEQVSVLVGVRVISVDLCPSCLWIVLTCAIINDAAVCLS